MIQRQQTLWLIVSAVAAFLTYKFPFYSGNIIEEGNRIYKELDSGSNFFLLVLTGASLLLAAIAIFLFKDRKTQLKLTIGGIVAAIGLIIVYFTEVKKFETGRYSLTCIFSFAILVGFVLASRGIWRDEKLVKSLDKLR